MRRALCLLALSPLSLLVACTGDDSYNAGDAGSPAADASSPDATVSDSGGGGTPDAASATDAGTGTDTGAEDAGSPDAADAADAAGPVVVHLVNAGVPVAGATVFFSDPTGLLLFTDTTDATGTVTQVVSGGEQATAVFPDARPPSLITVVGVQPGDVLTADEANAELNYVQAVVSAPPPNAPDGTETYTFDIAGNTVNDPSYPFNTYPYSVNGQFVDDTFPALVIANGDGGVPLAFTYEKGIAPDAGEGTYAVTFPDAGWSDAMTTQTVTATSASSVPTASTALSFSEVTGGVLSSQSAAFPGESPYAASFTGHTGFPDFVQSELTVNAGFLGDAGPTYAASISAVATRSDAPTASGGVSIDATQLLPYVTNVTVDTSTPTRPVVTWTTSGSLATTIAGFTDFGVQTHPTDGGASVYSLWTFVFPSTATSVQAPVLPASITWGPDVGSQVGGNQGVVVAFVQGGGLGTYGEVRSAAGAVSAFTNGLWNPGQPNPPIVPPLPADGTLQMTAYTLPGD